MRVQIPPTPSSTDWHCQSVLLYLDFFYGVQAMQILVTGAAGFIGSHFVEHVLSRHPDWRISNLDALTYAGFKHTSDALEQAYPGRYRLVTGSVCDAELIDSLVADHPLIVHFAAESNVDLSIVSGQAFLETNILGTQTLLEACRRHGSQRLLVVSTDEVYGNAWQDRPSRESDPLLPCSPYAASKAGQDLLAFSYYETFGLPVLRSRCANNYGPRQDPTKLIPRFILHALHDRPLPLYGHGGNTRDWIHVRDHCAALEALLLGPESLNGQVFNIGSGDELSARAVGEWLLRELGKPASLLQSVPDRLGHVKRHAVDSSLLRETLGWEPQIVWEAGMRATLDWYLAERGWWQAAIRDQAARIPGYEATYQFSEWD